MNAHKHGGAWGFLRPCYYDNRLQTFSSFFSGCIPMNHQQRNDLYTEVFGGMDDIFNRYLQVGKTNDVLQEMKRAALDYIIQETPEERQKPEPPEATDETNRIRKRYS